MIYKQFKIELTGNYDSIAELKSKAEDYIRENPTQYNIITTDSPAKFQITGVTEYTKLDDFRFKDNGDLIPTHNRYIIIIEIPFNKVI